MMVQGCSSLIAWMEEAISVAWLCVVIFEGEMSFKFIGLISSDAVTHLLET